MKPYSSELLHVLFLGNPYTSEFVMFQERLKMNKLHEEITQYFIKIL